MSHEEKSSSVVKEYQTGKCDRKEYLIGKCGVKEYQIRAKIGNGKETGPKAHR